MKLCDRCIDIMKGKQFPKNSPKWEKGACGACNEVGWIANTLYFDWPTIAELDAAEAIAAAIKDTTFAVKDWAETTSKLGLDWEE